MTDRSLMDLFLPIYVICYRETLGRSFLIFRVCIIENRFFFFYCFKLNHTFLRYLHTGLPESARCGLE